MDRVIPSHIDLLKLATNHAIDYHGDERNSDTKDFIDEERSISREYSGAHWPRYMWAAL